MMERVVLWDGVEGVEDGVRDGVMPEWVVCLSTEGSALAQFDAGAHKR
jgi:hypothetical protein